MSTKKFALIASALVLAALIACVFTGCLSIGLKETNVMDRLRDKGAVVTTPRNDPITNDLPREYSKPTTLLATLSVPETDPETGEEIANEHRLYIFYCRDNLSAKWVEQRCKDFVIEQKALMDNGDESAMDTTGWANVYRRDDVVMMGHYKIMSIARGY